MKISVLIFGFNKFPMFKKHFNVNYGNKVELLFKWFIYKGKEDERGLNKVQPLLLKITCAQLCVIIT